MTDRDYYFGCPEVKSALTEKMNVIFEPQDEEGRGLVHGNGRMAAEEDLPNS